MSMLNIKEQKQVAAYNKKRKTLLDLHNKQLLTKSIQARKAMGDRILLMAGELSKMKNNLPKGVNFIKD